jgi:hypothetical protein
MQGFRRAEFEVFSPRTRVARGAAAPLPSRRLRLALIKRLCRQPAERAAGAGPEMACPSTGGPLLFLRLTTATPARPPAPFRRHRRACSAARASSRSARAAKAAIACAVAARLRKRD